MRIIHHKRHEESYENMEVAQVIDQTICQWQPRDLRCEYAINPLAIETSFPRLSWQATHPERGQLQTAYQVLVASTEDLLAKDIGDIWDSGKVTNRESVVEYGGKELGTGERCVWKVRVWDSQDRMSSHSMVANFRMGLLSEREWQGEWIASPCPRKGVSPIFRKVFQLIKPVQNATAYICGLGYYELRLNGQKVGDSVLDPGFTDYGKRAMYVAHDVQKYLQEGVNALGVILGEGWYGNDHRTFTEFVKCNPSWIGTPRFILQLNVEYTDGSNSRIVSREGDDWWVTEGPIVENGVYDGETYDARQEKRGWDTAEYKLPELEDWVAAVISDGPGGVLVAQHLEPIKVVRDLPPVKLSNPQMGVYVFDLGQNIAGWGRLQLTGPEGTTITLKYAEILGDDGLVNQAPLRNALATDRYILNGQGEEVWEPRFTYHGFRYVQLEGYPGVPNLATITGRVVRSSVAETSRFVCSNPLLNQIQQNVLWTEAGNLHSVPTDCPQRDERMGWLNDFTVRAEEIVYNFDVVRLLAKWEDDIADTQDVEGGIGDTAPFVFGTNPADPVCTSFLLIPWFLYTHYGDRSTLRRHYEGLKRWEAYLGSRAVDFIVQYSYYGDWASPVVSNPSSPISGITPGVFMSTGYYYYNARLLAQMARVLGNTADVAHYTQLADQIYQALNKTYFQAETGQYAQGSQAAQAFALFLGLVPEEKVQVVADRLAEDVRAHGIHPTTGNLCTKYLMEMLSEYGYTDLAYGLATQTSYPSWGYMIDQGATTIWERWELAVGSEMNSHSHPMYGTVSSWFLKYLSGIQVDPQQPGFAHFVIRPFIPKDLMYVDALVHTVRGEVASCWRQTEQGIYLNVIVPFNSTASIQIPIGNATVLKESGEEIWRDGCQVGTAPGLINIKEQSDRVLVEVGSGSYYFAG